MSVDKSISVPALYEGGLADISWTADAGAASYLLQRAPDSGTDYSTIYNGVDNAYTDRVPAGHEVQHYRVAAVYAEDSSWNKLDEKDRSFEEIEALDAMWIGVAGGWTASGPCTVVMGRAPTIGGQNEHLGGKYKGFVRSFWVAGPDAEIGVEVYLDDARILEIPLAVHHEVYEVEVMDEQVLPMEMDSEHLLRIVATDSGQMQAERVYGFRRSQDLVSGAVYYVLRDGEAVARLDQPGRWTDYLALGLHSYVVRAVDAQDNYSDSGELRLEVSVDGAVLADVDEPDSMLWLQVRRGAKPRIDRSAALRETDSVYFEGRELPVAVGVQGQSEVVQLSFTHRRAEDWLAMERLQGKLVAYRDVHGNKLFGVLESVEDEFARSGSGDLVDFIARIRRVAFEEAVRYE